jgi:hypothetical protein
MKAFNPAQDYLNSKMIYTVKIDGEKGLVTSGRQRLDTDAMELTVPSVTVTRMSEDAVRAYLAGGKEPVPGDCLARLVDYVKRFVLLPEDVLYTTLALWAIGTYAFRVFRYYPYIHLNAEKGSGKTTLMETLAPICFNGVISSDATGAALYREVNDNSSTLFLDELEHVPQSVLRLLNAGFSKSGAIRRKDRAYCVYSPKMFASIGSINDVLGDRSIQVRLKRRLPTEMVERYIETEAVAELQSSVRDDLYVFGLEHAANVAALYAGELPELSSLGNRAWDIWAPIVAIGKVVGADIEAIVEFARRSVAEKQSVDENENDTVRLLMGLKAMISALKPQKEDAGKTVWFYDCDMVQAYFKALGVLTQDATRTGLSRLLNHRFGIIARPERVGGGVKRLYAIDLAKIDDYAARYLTREFRPESHLRLALTGEHGAS